MSNPGEANTTPVTDVRQLAEYLATGCRPRSAWRIGTEHEKFGFSRAGHFPLAYEGPRGIRTVLEGLARHSGWEPILDRGHPIGLRSGVGREHASVSLEPAGQLELSGAALETLHDTKRELEAHFASLRSVAGPLEIGFAPLGFHPTATRAEMHWMPKARYAIMREYMPKVGTLGLDMMLRTCTVQVNLDTESEADMVRKLRVGLALQPVATALFANSPFTEGRPNGFLSYRAHIWTDTDPDRTGIPSVVFEEGFGFERWVQWLLDVPMYFLVRDGALVNLAGQSFRAFLEGRLPGREGELPTIGDFADHTTTAFPDARLKRFIEMRGADAGSPAMMLAQSALWVGLLYDEAALDAAYALVRSQPWTKFAALRPLVARLGPRAPWQLGTVRDLARDMLAIAADGLRARGHGEERYLDPLHAIAAGAPTQAEHWLARYESAWRGDARRIFEEAAI